MPIAEISVDVAASAQTQLGEGPRWDDRTQTLLFVDIEAGRVFRFDPATSSVVGGFDAGGPVSAIGLCDDDSLLMAMGRTFATCDSTGGKLRALEGFALTDQRVRFNDGAVDPWGRFVAGTMDLRATEPIGGLYRLDGSGEVEQLLDGITISNGIAWSREKGLMYYVDSIRGGVDVFAMDDRGNLGPRRPVVQFETSKDGGPDGLALDTDGCIWVACWAGSAVRRISATGVLDAIIRLPVTNVTSVAFGGHNFDDLYITTARNGLDAGELRAQPHAGDLFVASVGVTGIPSTRFRWTSQARTA